eukprot:CAMPEP_0119033678 /NCGR_PEP_ID=MMETSP1177-20130426/730_1 /TAXON_ID=2985 /ORGANISM="Ochromonas sp, Strain CCMP1899" /LENGTH=332 /DNA_ID=CAMNT_0006990603 /DNA_START=232 /DNA_END=1230 /DNA_ORIENTATION=+
MDCDVAASSTVEVLEEKPDNLSLGNPGFLFDPRKAPGLTPLPTTLPNTPSSSYSSKGPLWARADRVGYFVECSDEFRAICGFKGDFHSHSIIDLVRPTTPEGVQQQAYMLDSIASSKPKDVNRKKKWMAELKYSYMDVSYEMHVTYSTSSDSYYALDVELVNIPNIPRSNMSRSGSIVSRSNSITKELLKSPARNVRSLLILIVDDSITVLKILKRLITGEGHEVVCKTNGIEALEALKHTDFDAVFMDIIMPVMGGLEASSEFRIHEDMLHQYRGKSHSTKLKIIAMSADFNKALIVEVLAAGFDGFLAKPLSLMNFRNLKLTPSLTRVMS